MVAHQIMSIERRKTSDSESAYLDRLILASAASPASLEIIRRETERNALMLAAVRAATTSESKHVATASPNQVPLAESKVSEKHEADRGGAEVPDT